MAAGQFMSNSNLLLDILPKKKKFIFLKLLFLLVSFNLFVQKDNEGD